MVEEHFAGHLRVAQLGVTLHVGIERAANTATTAAAGNHDAVDVEETGVALLEPREIAAVVVAVAAEADEKTGQVAVALGDAEVFGGVVEAADLGGIQRQDGQAGVVVQCQDGIELVLAHVADDDRH